MVMEMTKIYYSEQDICVACGMPSVPGEQICRECQKKVTLQQAEDIVLYAFEKIGM